MPHARLLIRDYTNTQKILSETSGLWQGRKLDPISYQRKMRSSYNA